MWQLPAAARLMAARLMAVRMMAVRLVTALLVAAGCLTAWPIPALAAASRPGISVSASSPLGRVFGHTLVIYKTAAHHLDLATISGDVSGAAPGDVVTLLAEPFGRRAFRPAGTSFTVSPSGPGPVPYTFQVTPSLATRYKVQVSTAGTVTATSGVRVVYVTPGGRSGDQHDRCASGTCTSSWTEWTVVPASAFQRESRKRWYVYFSFDLRVPAFLSLDRNASATRARRINAREFRVTFTVTFASPLTNPFPHVYLAACTKDSETRDGIGLPGHHGCGDRKISWSARYVG